MPVAFDDAHLGRCCNYAVFSVFDIFEYSEFHFIAPVLFAFLIWRVGLCGNFAPATHRKNDFNTITTNRKMFSPLW